MWRGGDGPPLVTSCLITTAANTTVRPYHDRMPVVLPEAAWDEWLDPATPVARLFPQLRPFDGPMVATRANQLVNKAGIEGPALLAGYAE